MSEFALLSPIQREMHHVAQQMEFHLRSEVALVNQIGHYITQAGGKRLRPALLILFAKALGYQGDMHGILGAVVEYIHTATLLHDDVVDESELRRGRKTANVMFGNAASVLVGDFLYSRAFQMMASTHLLAVMEVLSDATNVIAEGEVLQLLNLNDEAVDERHYLKVISCKTAKLFAASSELGVVLVNGDQTLRQQAALFGHQIGLAFQIIDDVLDYESSSVEMGKTAGDDLREGKPTLPLIYALTRGNPQQVDFLKNCIKNPNVSQSEMEHRFINARTLLSELGAFDYARQKAVSIIHEAKAAIAPIPSSIYKQCLLDLCDFSLTRTY